MRWKKADVIAGAYKQLVEASNKPVAALATITAGGELLTQYAEPGSDTARLVALPKTISGNGEIGTRSIRLGDELISIAPSGKDSSGQPYGHLVVAWKTDAISNSLRSLQNSLMIKLSIAVLVIVVAILLALSRLEAARSARWPGAWRRSPRSIPARRCPMRAAATRSA